MEELIKITTREDGSQVVSARVLYDYFAPSERFHSWMDRNLNYGFVINSDFTPITSSHPQNKQELLDFALTLDCAKEISMLQRSELGKKARIYFIEMEKVAKSKLSKFDIPSDFESALRLAADQQKLIKEQTNLIEAQTTYIQEAQPKVEYADKVLSSVSDHTTTTIAKELGTSAITLNKRLKDKGVQYKHDGNWVLYAKYQNKGLTTTRTYPYIDSKGEAKTEIHTVWTEEGRNFIHKLFNEKLK